MDDHSTLKDFPPQFIVLYLQKVKASGTLKVSYIFVV